METYSRDLNKPSDALIEYCQRYRTVPVAMDSQILQLATDRELTPHEESTLRFISHRQLQIIQWQSSQVDVGLQQLSGDNPNQALENAGRLYVSQAEARSQTDIEHAEDDPVVAFINGVLQQALERRASDIHFEPYANRYRVRLRIDGVLQDGATPPSTLAARIAARLKVMAQLNIAERRLPQDGQMALQHESYSYAIRVSTLPVADGEKIVLRVMESGKQPLSINQLGMPELLQQQYLKALAAPQGLILVTGPTGSGKTVSLYSGLNHLNHSDSNICSIEDPVEIVLEGINQTQVNLKAGLTFSQALRAFLRQDPDVIMVGEIRDRETAEIAIESAQTGHLVLSTLHTNSTVDTLIRLSQMGIASYLLAASLNLIIAQRLVRCLCPHCKRPAAEPLVLYSADRQEPLVHWQAAGCGRCLGGYFGRTGVYEMLVISSEIRQQLLSGGMLSGLQQIACQQGMTLLFDAGLALVRQGIISLGELYRVLGKSTLYAENRL